MAQEFNDSSNPAGISPQGTSPVSPIAKPGRKGFLPFNTNTWDRFFVSVLCYVAISLIWMRFLEPYLFAGSIWIAVAISIALGAFIIRRG